MQVIAQEHTMSSRKRVGRPRKHETTPFADWVAKQWTGTHVELAEQLKIGEDYLSNLLHGTQKPGLVLAKKIKRLSKNVLTLDALCDFDSAPPRD